MDLFDCMREVQQEKDAPNLLITPHVAGGQHLESIPYAVLKIAIHNIHALETDKNFVSVVDGETGYRKLV